MKLSFKFKIATLSFAVSGTILTTFGIAFFAFIYSSGLDRMDRELRALVEAPLRGGHPEQYWKAFDNSLKFIHGDEGNERIALIVLDSLEKTLYSSDNARVQFTYLPRPELPESTKDTNAQRFLNRNDRNKDGRVSRDEFDGPSPAFSRSDKNNDGFIDRTEAATFRPPRRPGESPDAPLPHSGSAPPSVARFTTLNLAFENWRVGIFCNPETTIIAAMDMNAFNAEVDTLRTIFMVSVPIGLLILGFMGWFLADRAMQPVAAIAETAKGITAKGLDRRIPKVGNDVELERLVDVSNDMLDRLEKSYHQAVRFSADAAHELQTPLTILQGELDNAIQTSETGSGEQQRYSMLLGELGNLKAVVQKLLLLAHADEGRLNLNRQPVDLSDLVANAAEDIEIMAPELEIVTEIEKGVIVSADLALINQAIRNMTSNAAKYASKNGRAAFQLQQYNNEARFTLANTAPPIPEEDFPLLFERFHRVDKARTASGSGLGLSLAREIARAHNGDLVLYPYTDGMVSFTLSLPLT